MKRKSIIIALALILAMSFTACSRSATDDIADDTSVTETVSVEDETETEESETESEESETAEPETEKKADAEKKEDAKKASSDKTASSNTGSKSNSSSKSNSNKSNSSSKSNSNKSNNSSASKPSNNSDSKPNGNSGSNSNASKPQTPSQDKPKPAEPSKPAEPQKPVHTHDWVYHESEGYNKCIQKAYDEPIVKTTKTTVQVCGTCRAEFATADKAIEHVAFSDNCQNYHSEVRTKEEITGYKHHDAIYQWVEPQTAYYSCSCGATK